MHVWNVRLIIMKSLIMYPGYSTSEKLSEYWWIFPLKVSSTVLGEGNSSSLGLHVMLVDGSVSGYFGFGPITHIVFIVNQQLSPLWVKNVHVQQDGLHQSLYSWSSGWHSVARGHFCLVTSWISAKYQTSLRRGKAKETKTTVVGTCVFFFEGNFVEWSGSECPPPDWSF